MHVQDIRRQNKVVTEINDKGESSEQIKRKQVRKIKRRVINRANTLDQTLSPEILEDVKQPRDKGASAWLAAMPLGDLSFGLNKWEFKDALHLRYNIPLSNLPSYCSCGERFNV